MKPALAGAVIGLVLGVLLTSLPFELEPSFLLGLMVAGAVLGAVSGAVRRGDRCSDPECRARLPNDAKRCPGCRGHIAGRIRHERDRLEAEEQLDESWWRSAELEADDEAELAPQQSGRQDERDGMLAVLVDALARSWLGPLVRASLGRWYRARRRARVRARRFPPRWEKTLSDYVWPYAGLSAEERRVLRDRVSVFLDEIYFVGCEGLEVTEEMRVAVAGQAGLMILALDDDFFAKVETVYLFPTGFRNRDHRPGDRAVLDGVAHARSGAVVLAWDVVERERSARTGSNVVHHELAHKLDMLGGVTDGIPPIADRDARQRFIDVCSQEWADLVVAVDEGEDAFLDDYAARNQVEFFAVASELFFNDPCGLEEAHPELYDVLRGFYRQDPAERLAPR